MCYKQQSESQVSRIDKAREQLCNKGLSTCSSEQVTSQVKDDASSGRNSTTNAWYINTSNGNRNNTNSYNRYRVIGASELINNWED